MAELKEVIGYFCTNYPVKDELSDARLTKLIYLADWKSAIDTGSQLTPIKWFFNHYGPYVTDVWKTAHNDEAFNIENTSNMFGNPKQIVSLKKPIECSSLDDHDRKILDHVIEKTKQLSWAQFIQLVYSTFPVLVSSRHTSLNLAELADRYNEHHRSR